MSKKPRLSINKLGEYMTASAVRQRSIIYDQKHPKEQKIKTVRYAEARAAYTEYVISGFNAQIIHDAVSSLSGKLCTSDFQTNDRDTSLEVLALYNDIGLPDISVYDAQPFNGNGKMDISGVDISVYPDIILRGTYRKKKVVGAIKFHIIKTNALNEEARRYVATTLHQFVDEHVKGEDEIVPCDLVFSIDVFARKCESAPKSNRKRRSDIQATCSQIAAWWVTM